jgi:hypothetical protein
MKSFLAVMFLLGSFAVAHAQKTSVVPGICDPTSHVDVIMKREPFNCNSMVVVQNPNGHFTFWFAGQRMLGFEGVPSPSDPSSMVLQDFLIDKNPPNVTNAGSCHSSRGLVSCNVIFDRFDAVINFRAPSIQ